MISLEIIDDNTPLEQNESVTLQFTPHHNFVAAQEFLRDTAIVNISVVVRVDSMRFDVLEPPRTSA